MLRSLMLIALFAGGCTTVHPALRDLADHDIVGDPEGYTKAEWIERLEKAESNDKLVNVVELGDGWVCATGFASGPYTDIHWQIIDHDNPYAAVTLGRLREPLPGDTLAAQAAVLGFQLNDEPHAKGLIFFDWDPRRSYVGVLASEPYQETTNPRFILILDGDDRISRVLRRCEDCNGSWTKFEKDDGIPGAEGFLSGDSGPRVKTAPRVAALEARAKAEAIAAQETEQRGLEAGAAKKIAVAALMAKTAQLITSGEVEALERQWGPLHEAHDDLARTSRTLARSLEREVLQLQRDAASLLMKSSADREGKGLIGSAAMAYWSAAELVGVSRSRRSLEKALKDRGTEPLAQAQHLTASLSLELVPKIEGPAAKLAGEFGAYSNLTKLVDGWEQFGSLAMKGLVLKLTVGEWEGRRRVTSTTKNKKQSTYLASVMVPNTQGIAEWKNEVAQLEREFNELNTATATYDPPAAVREVGQESVYTSGPNPVEMGRRGYDRESKASERRREEYAQRYAEIEREVENMHRRAPEARRRWQYAAQRPPPSMIQGSAPKDWTYDEVCQTWTGTMKRPIAINGNTVIQTIGESPDQVCYVEADPQHNVVAQGEKLGEGGSMLRILEDSGKPVAGLVAPLIQKAVEEAIEVRLTELRSKGATASEVDRERAMLKRVLFENNGPPLVPLVAPK